MDITQMAHSPLEGMVSATKSGICFFKKKSSYTQKPYRGHIRESCNAVTLIASQEVLKNTRTVFAFVALPAIDYTTIGKLLEICVPLGSDESEKNMEENVTWEINLTRYLRHTLFANSKDHKWRGNSAVNNLCYLAKSVS